MMKPDVSRRSIGVNLRQGRAEIRLWAPEHRQVDLCIGEKKIPLQRSDAGYWQLNTTELKEGDLYKFLIDGSDQFPDPASLSQPRGVHGPSRVTDLKAYSWNDGDWKNPALEDYIIYELHAGTFTAEGGFGAVEKKLDHLLELGVNAIEIMPVAQFPGDRNWGYDGVFPFAVQESYGGAERLMQLVDACHQKGIAVVLDVVYNHLGPEGNYLGAYGPYTTEKYKTPWGGAINFDDAWCDGVRDYFIENALMWLRDFHIDALRLDAVHAIKDFSPRHILQEIREGVDELMKQTGRQHYLIVELDLNDTRFINETSAGGFGMNAQWIDEFHHALRVTALGEKTGYYSDFDGIQHLAKAYRDAYVYDGQFSPHRKKNFGVKTANEGKQFVVFSQNHDQVGNRMLGERTSQLAGFEMQKLLAAAVLLSPYLPMLFMGEEWGETNPFLYFVSHGDPRLCEAVRKGRKEEFAAFHAEGEAPDPTAEETFLQSKLQWELRETEPHRTLLLFYKTLIALRRSEPALKNLGRRQLHVEADTERSLLTLHRWTDDQHILALMNFSAKEQFVMPPSNVQEWTRLLDSADPAWRGPKAAPFMISGGVPGTSSLAIQPHSVLVYADQIHSNIIEHSK